MKPIEGKCYITQEYGLTPFARTAQGKEFYKNFGGIHPGVDWGTGGVNAPVISTCAGKVVRAGMDGGWGNHVEVQGVDGWNRQYAHLQSVSVKVGDSVITGTRLGNVGNTGASTAIHLHAGSRRRKMLGGWEYRDPSADFQDAPQPVMPTKKLIKGRSGAAVYVFNGRTKFGIPNGETLEFFFEKDGWSKIEEIEIDILSKIPTGMDIPSML